MHSKYFFPNNVPELEKQNPYYIIFSSATFIFFLTYLILIVLMQLSILFILFPNSLTALELPLLPQEAAFQHSHCLS